MVDLVLTSASVISAPTAKTAASDTDSQSSANDSPRRRASLTDDWYPFPVSPEDPEVITRALRNAEGELIGAEYQYIDTEGSVWSVRDDYITRERSFHQLPGTRS